jgi:hypothetical protein
MNSHTAQNVLRKRCGGFRLPKLSRESLGPRRDALSRHACINQDHRLCVPVALHFLIEVRPYMQAMADSPDDDLPGSRAAQGWPGFATCPYTAFTASKARCQERPTESRASSYVLPAHPAALNQYCCRNDTCTLPRKLRNHRKIQVVRSVLPVQPVRRQDRKRIGWTRRGYAKLSV